MYLINISSFNAYIIYKKATQIGRYKFLHETGPTNCKEVQNRNKIISRTQMRRPNLEGNYFHLRERQFFILIPPTDKKDKPTRRYIVCNKHERRMEDQYLCGTYQETLCIFLCFELYHTRKQY